MPTALGRLSSPAVLAAISYTLLAAVLLLPSHHAAALLTGDSPPPQPQPLLPLTARLAVLLLLVPSALLSIYSINCMIVGSCRVWSWVQSVALAVYVLLFVALGTKTWTERPTSVSAPLQQQSHSSLLATTSVEPSQEPVSAGAGPVSWQAWQHSQTR
jgi:membrane protein implicated in regulation of membrane protease activity